MSIQYIDDGGSTQLTAFFLGDFRLFAEAGFNISV
jgi:hypothetical protein